MDEFKYKRLSLIISVFLVLYSFSNPSGKEESLAIRGGKFITMTRGVLENGILLIQKGKIAAIGKDIPIPAEAKVIDASKYTVLPGYIDAFTNLGTTDPISREKDYDEGTAALTPQLRIIDAINPEDTFIPFARKTGVTSVLSAPGEENLLSGQSALIHLSGETLEEMLVKFPVAVHGSLGEAPKLRYGKKGELPSTRMGEAALLRQTLADTQDYLNKIQAYEKKRQEYEKKKKEGQADPSQEPLLPPVDWKLQALIPILKGEIPLIIRANRMDDILTALRIADEFGIKLILNHASDGYKAAQELALRKIPVLVGPVASYRQTVETSSAIYENASILQKAGIKIAFQTGSIQNFGDIIYQASLAYSHGLPYEEALKALTIYPARILGVEDKLGSLEKGKIADLIVVEGDPLSPLSKVKMVIIEGKIVEDLMRNKS